MGNGDYGQWGRTEEAENIVNVIDHTECIALGLESVESL